MFLHNYVADKVIIYCEFNDTWSKTRYVVWSEIF